MERRRFIEGLGAALALTGVVGRAGEPRGPASARASVMVVGGTMMNGDHFADSVLPGLREHYRGCTSIALVLHASHPTERDRMEARLQTAFAHLGVARAASLHRSSEAGANDVLAKADGIFVGGGETFVLLRDLHRTRQLQIIRERVRAGVPYGGSSAGANVAGTLIGTTNDFPVADIPSREALGFIPAAINPHHPLPAAKADFDGRVVKIKTYLKFNPEETVLALANASMVRLHAGEARLVAGSGWIYRQSGVRALERMQAIPELAAAQ